MSVNAFIEEFSLRGGGGKTIPSELNQYWGGSITFLNKSESLSHFSSSFVCFSYTNRNL
jgi:hypothetical protein